MSLSRSVTGLSLLLFTAGAPQAATPSSPPSLAQQAAAMPADFRAHFFNAPISARVMLDGRLLGDASIVLGEDERVQLISFTDVSASEATEAERQRWLSALSHPVPLGQCSSGCPADLVAADYNLASAQLTLISAAAPAGAEQALWHPLPEKASAGLLLASQLNLSAGQRQDGSASWLGGLEAALGNWSAIGQYQLDRSGARDAQTRHAVTSLYLMREQRETFYRAGLFSPDSQGVLRQPYSRGGGVTTLAGVMTGSSDTLMKDGNTPALFPVWVTANREGVAEIYRNGVLINAQPVKPGLQALDTAPLPGGIYEVEVRVLEDGREVSRSAETVNKPSGWRNPGQRLRYNLFAGRQASLMSGGRDAQNDQDGSMAAGASLNYLIRPDLTGGAALQKAGRERQAGVSLDWQAGQQVQLYGNVWHSSVTGYGFDSQAMWTHARGNVALNHSRSWYAPEARRHGFYGDARTTQSTSLSSGYRLDSSNSVTARLTHRSDTPGLGVDAGYSTRMTVAGTPVNLQLSAFDRPYRDSGSTRNRGVALTASFSLGGGGRSASASLGSRTDAQGGRDLYASATVNQSWEDSVMKQSSLTATADRYGAGLSTYSQFDAPLASGSFWGQRASTDGGLSGGLSAGSTLAFGQGKAALSRDAQQHQGGGMIVDVVSDDPSVSLMAYHDAGSVPLKAGRNFIPVQAWKPGTVQVDFPGRDAPALKAWPQYLDYHHVRGGVSSHEVRVMKTVTVMGRLVDRNGNPLGGAHVINHAGRTVTEPDGMFTLELHEKNPVVNIEHHSGMQCEIRLNPAEQKRGELVFAGNVTCEGTTLAQQRGAEGKSDEA